MKRAFLIAAMAVVVAGCGSTKTVTRTVTVTTNAAAKLGLGPPSEIVEFGHIKSLKPHGSGYVMRFDPAWLLSGKTANQFQFENTGTTDVPNDHLVFDETHRLLTYLVPPSAHVTVITDRGTAGLGPRPIKVDELARIVNGGKHLKLFEPLLSGIWLTIHDDTARTIDQQYAP